MFRGLRIGEACAINIYDFQDANFQKFNVIFEKTHILDQVPIIKEFNDLLKEYILKNMHTFKDGYIFPYYSSRKKAPHMTTDTAANMFYKLRKIISKDHPGFNDFVIYIDSSGNQKHRHRITLHSIRRWFETTLDDHGVREIQIADIMRYQKKSSVYSYLNPYRTWRKEQEILQQTFGPIFQDFNNVVKGQMKLDAFR